MKSGYLVFLLTILALTSVSVVYGSGNRDSTGLQFSIWGSIFNFFSNLWNGITGAKAVSTTVNTTSYQTTIPTTQASTSIVTTSVLNQSTAPTTSSTTIATSTVTTTEPTTTKTTSTTSVAPAKTEQCGVEVQVYVNSSIYCDGYTLELSRIENETVNTALFTVLYNGSEVAYQAMQAYSSGVLRPSGYPALSYVVGYAYYPQYVDIEISESASTTTSTTIPPTTTVATTTTPAYQGFVSAQTMGSILDESYTSSAPEASSLSYTLPQGAISAESDEYYTSAYPEQPASIVVVFAFNSSAESYLDSVYSVPTYADYNGTYNGAEFFIVNNSNIDGTLHVHLYTSYVFYRNYTILMTAGLANGTYEGESYDSFLTVGQMVNLTKAQISAMASGS